MINITREYINAKVAKAQDGLTDVIVGIYCVVTAMDDSTGISESAGKDFSVGSPDPSTFTPFDQVTADLLDSWITPKPEYIELENFMRDSVQNRVNANYVNMPLPFNPPAPPAPEMKRMPDLNRVQFMFMVRKLNLEQAIPAAISQLPETTEQEVNTKLLANTLWTDGQIFERDHPMFTLLAPLLNITDDQLDQIWLEATQV